MASGESNRPELRADDDTVESEALTGDDEATDFMHTYPDGGGGNPNSSGGVVGGGGPVSRPGPIVPRGPGPVREVDRPEH
jgi:hypothetical protein